VRTFFRCLAAVVAMAAFFVLAPESAVAQDCQICDHPTSSTHHFHWWSCQREGNCYSCTEGPPGNEGCHEEERGQDCDQWHGHCTGPRLPVADVIDAYKVGDMRTVARALVEDDEVYGLNAERGALQARLCGEEVIAHLPLTETEFRVLSTLLSHAAKERQSSR